jgi:glycosyltransferase involved in cell wall biosynthesis
VGSRPKWFPLSAKLISVPVLSEQLASFAEQWVPDGDILVATGWSTAYPVSRLSSSKGKKIYFVQHYEVWDLWNSKEYWEEIEKRQLTGVEVSLGIGNYVPKDPLIRQTKELVDSTFRLPFLRITTSSFLKRLIERELKAKVEEPLVTIGNNFSTFSFNGRKKRSGLSVLMPYRNLKWKGDEDGLRVLETVRKAIPEVECRAYGPKKPAAFPPWIRFYERPTDDELRELYASSNVLLFSSWAEGYGSPPMEAMACRTACVTTDVGAVSDYSIPGKTAIVVPPRDVGALTKGVLDLLMNERKRAEVAEAGYQYIQQFTWDKTVDRMEILFCKAMEK